MTNSHKQIINKQINRIKLIFFYQNKLKKKGFTPSEINVHDFPSRKNFLTIFIIIREIPAITKQDNWPAIITTIWWLGISTQYDDY